jgi:AraC-like DNA-binding protein
LFSQLDHNTPIWGKTVVFDRFAPPFSMPAETESLSCGQALVYGNAGRGKVEFYWVLFNGRDLPLIFQELRAGTNPLFARLPCPRTEIVFRKLIDLVAMRDPLFEPRISTLLMELLAELFEIRRPPADLVRMGKREVILSETVKRGLDYVFRGYGLPITIKEIAAEAGASLFYFSRVFHREMGMPPAVYLNRYRIERAKELLERSNSSILVVGQRVGIPNQHYFARLFKRLAGISPRQYRERMRSPPRRHIGWPQSSHSTQKE